jgi:hypothetical protein
MGFHAAVIEHECLERGALRFAALVTPEMERRDLGPDSSRCRIGGRGPIERGEGAGLITKPFEALRHQELEVRFGHLRGGVTRQAQHPQHHESTSKRGADGSGFWDHRDQGF